MKFLLEIEVEATDLDAVHASVADAMLGIQSIVRDAPNIHCGTGDGLNYTFNYKITEGESKWRRQMKIKTSELTGAALDRAVMQCKGLVWSLHGHIPFSTDWAEGGPIIQSEELSNLKCYGKNDWGCNNGDIFCDGPTPLIAAMRCYVTCKLGEEIEIPEELK